MNEKDLFNILNASDKEAAMKAAEEYFDQQESARKAKEAEAAAAKEAEDKITVARDCLVNALYQYLITIGFDTKDISEQDINAMVKELTQIEKWIKYLKRLENL